MNDSDLDGRSIHVREDKVAEVAGVKSSLPWSALSYILNKQDNSAPTKSPTGRPRRQADIPPEEKVVEPTKVFVSNLTWSTSEEVSECVGRSSPSLLLTLYNKTKYIIACTYTTHILSDYLKEVISSTYVIN